MVCHIYVCVCMCRYLGLWFYCSWSLCWCPWPILPWGRGGTRTMCVGSWGLCWAGVSWPFAGPGPHWPLQGESWPCHSSHRRVGLALHQSWESWSHPSCGSTLGGAGSTPQHGHRRTNPDNMGSAEAQTDQPIQLLPRPTSSALSCPPQHLPHLLPPGVREGTGPVET